jgi:predicted PurR-regulated permease PerM
MNPKGIAEYFPLILVAGAILLAFQILLPFLVPLALAAAFAAVLQPLYIYLQRKMDGHDELAAIIALLVVGVGILVPLGFIVTQHGFEAARLYGSVLDGSFVQNSSSLLKQLQHSLPPDIIGPDFSDQFASNLGTYTRESLVWVSAHFTDAFSSIASILLNLFIFFCALFFFLRDGDAIKKAIVELSPLRDRDDELIFRQLSRSVNSVIRGNLLIVLIRGVLTAVGFMIFGIPNPILWGTLAGIAGLIPAIGITLVFAPGVLYAAFVFGWPTALGLLLWGLLIVGLVDNVLAPRFVGHGMQMHPLFVLLSIFGGISYFGPLGIFLGPLVLSFLFAVLSVYAPSGKNAVQ